MAKTLTFLDSDVLIASYRGTSPSKELAQAILKDPTRAFVVSAFLELEIMPNPIYHKNTPEVSAFRTYFEKALLRIGDLDEIVRIAREEAERCGLSAMDALHVAAAHIGGAQVLVTLENESKPMYRTSLVRVVHLSKLATVPRAPAPGSPGEAL